MSINPIYYSENVKKITQIEFSIFTNKDVELHSVVSTDEFGIDLAESYENYEPKKGGLVDLRLGTCDIYLPCTTCGENSYDCPGHFGHTKLAIPLFHYGFLKHLKNLLQCICLKCSKILVNTSTIDKKILSKKMESRYKEIKLLTKNINICYNCGTIVSKINKEIKDNGSIKIIIEKMVNVNEDDLKATETKKIKESLSPKDCYRIFKSISDDECRLLGFEPKLQRPEDMILEKLPIPPVIIRPTAKVDHYSSATMEDALTLKISDIITANKRVRIQLEKDVISNDISTYNQDIQNLLQYHIATIYDNDSLTLPKTEFKTGNRPIKSISDRIKGKQGRVRSNIMGKRVDFSARTVITSDPYINIDEVGVPKKIAMELTIPIEVTPFNKKYLSKLVKNGKDIYPGANYVLKISYKEGKSDIHRLDLKYRKKSIKLNNGDIVERHCINGDYVLFNRQPTLHKPSMMGHKMHIIDNDSLNTFRLNVDVVKPYHADFDGDEMNLHLPQSIQTRNEIKMIANVKYQIISAKDSSPIIGSHWDTLSGSYMLTDKLVKLKGWEVANLVCNTTLDKKYNIDLDKTYTGLEIFSYILPKGINYKKIVNDKTIIEIIDGELLQGNLDKSLLSYSKNSITHFIWDKFGPNKTRIFIDNAHKLILNYLLVRGQTVGIKDTIIDDDMKSKIKILVNNEILKLKYMITQFENDVNIKDLNYIEYQLTKELNNIQANVGVILMSYFNIDNFFWVASKSGAKGNPANISQMCGIVGQISLSGSRIKKNIENRSLIYFHENDDTPEARGFVNTSYIEGLKGYEFFINGAATREGFIDTAIKSVTWNTPIIIIDNNIPKYLNIGDWIDSILDNNKDKIKYEKELNMEIFDINNVYIPTTDYKGNVSWGEISAITRHDPGDNLYEIKTKSGRNVIVTESKSLLIWNSESNELLEKFTKDIKIGDLVPITVELNDPPFIKKSILNESLKLNLDYETGIFIGLYIGSGIINDNLITIQILDTSIYNFLVNYLNKYQINFLFNENNNDIHIYSDPLTIYLNKIKTVPKDAYISSTLFISGLLSGYCSTQVFVFDNNIITIDTNSNIMCNELILLFSRLGIFTYINELNQINISNEWILIFKDKIKLLNIDFDINFNINNINQKLNNIILDEIIQINPVNVRKHPKVYDLTIPSTFNFAIANGLQVRDTAQTGYIQRQLIKGLEDLIIKYDGTNRNAKNVIIQFIYGENGINQAEQSYIYIPIITMNNITIEKEYKFNDDQIKIINKNLKISIKDLNEFNNNYIEKLKKYRNDLRFIQTVSLLNYKILEEKYMLPINLIRITNDYTDKDNKIMDLNPLYIIECIESFLDDFDYRLVISLKPDNKYLKEVDRQYKYLLEIALYDYLSPYKCLFIYKLTKTNFDKMMKEIKLNYNKAIIEPGEMVGIISAQSVGEPTSQMSVLSWFKTRIIVVNKLSQEISLKTTNIGKFCDNFIETYPELTFNTGHEDSVETDLSTLDNEYYIVGVDKEEKTHWNKLSHISRHPINGNLMKIITKSGRSVVSTLSHSHLVRRNQTVEPIMGSDLKVGMRIPVAKHIENTFIIDHINIDDNKYQLDYLFGWFIGAYLAEGSINDNTILITKIDEPQFNTNTKLFANKYKLDVKIIHYQGDKQGDKHGNYITIHLNFKQLANLILENCGIEFEKRVPDFAFTAPNEFKAGLIQAYIDGNGNGTYNIYTHNKIHVASINEQLIIDISSLLCYFGIFGSIKCNKTKESNMYNLIISSKYAYLYREYIGTIFYYELDEIVEYARDNYNLIDDIDKINGLGDIIAKCGKDLKLEGQSRNYDRWKKKDVIGRRTLIKYIEIFEAHKDKDKIKNELDILNQAAYSDVIWDEIKEIEIYTPDQKDYVYDFTIPGNQTFMIDNGIIVHNTLNTKHFAGRADKSSANMGVSRIQELLHFSKNIKTPMMTIYFKEPYNTNSILLKKISSSLKFLSIKDLIHTAEIYYYLDSNTLLSTKLKNDNVSNPFFINNQKMELSDLPFVFRLVMNIEKMFDKETHLLDIKTKFISYWQKNYTNIKNLKKNDKDIITKINRCAILSNNMSDNEQIIHIRFNMSVINYNYITNFLKIILEDISLKGIENIANITEVKERKINYNNETGDMIIDKENIIYTEGINFEKILFMKGIDFTRTKCNDIYTTYKLYGIEAVRHILIHELITVYESSSIDINHLAVLVDQMCHNGEIISMDRHGLSKIDIDPIARASFEKQMEHFVNAALFNEKDKIKSISSYIALGKVINGGTGVFDILLDTKKLENSEYNENESISRITFSPLEEEPLLLDIFNENNNHTFFIP